MEIGANRTTLSRLTKEDSTEVLKECDAHEILKFSFLNNTFHQKIAQGFKYGKAAKVHLVLGLASEIVMTFAHNPAHDFRWQFCPSIAHLRVEPKKIVLESKRFDYKPFEYQGEKYCILDAKRADSVKYVFHLLRLLRSIFKFTIGAVIIQTTIFDPFLSLARTIETIQNLKCEVLNINGSEASDYYVAKILKKIQVSIFLRIECPLREGRKTKLDLTPRLSSCTTVLNLKRSILDCFEMAGPRSRFTIKHGSSTELNQVLFNWLHGISQSMQVFDVKIQKFEWKNISKLLSIFSHLAPDRSFDTFKELGITETLLKLSLEGVLFKRNDGAVATVHFSPNIPKADDGHRLLIHFQYPLNAANLNLTNDRKVESVALSPEVQLQKEKQLESCKAWLIDHGDLQFDSTKPECDLDKEKTQKKTCGYSVGMSVLCKLELIRTEYELLKMELEQSQEYYASQSDDEKRQHFGYFYV